MPPARLRFCRGRSIFVSCSAALGAFAAAVGLLALPIGWQDSAASTVLAAERASAFLHAMDSITAAELSHFANDLAGPAYDGREAGGRGGHAAGDYLVERLQALHLHGGAEPTGSAAAASDEGTDGPKNEQYFQHFAPNFRNVLVWIEGSDSELKSQVVVVAAHYDHVGHGTWRNSRGGVGRMHPGADDNASGTSSLLELAEALTLLPTPPRRSVLLAFFDAEEKGLLGSKYWTAHPTVPLANVAAMVNVDMVGRVRNEHLEVLGTRTAPGLRRLVAEQNDCDDLSLEFPWTMREEADHFPFFRAGVPVLALHSGLHNDYHTPRDTPDKLNPEGMRSVGRLLFALVCQLADQDDRYAWRSTAERETEDGHQALDARPARVRDRLGVGWRAGETSDRGVRVTRVTAASPADKAGLRPGDRIARVGEWHIADGDALRGAVATATNPALVVVRRDGTAEPLELSVDLEGPPMRLGVTWRVDPLEPGAVILTAVVRHTPADEAGLRPGDRIYQIDGRDFGDDAEFAARVGAAGDGVELLIDRDGRLQTVSVPLTTAEESHRRAA